MAPEVMAVLDAQIRAASPRGVARCKTRRCYDFRCDVWSLGAVVRQVEITRRVTQGSLKRGETVRGLAVERRRRDFVF